MRCVVFVGAAILIQSVLSSCTFVLYDIIFCIGLGMTSDQSYLRCSARSVGWNRPWIRRCIVAAATVYGVCQCVEVWIWLVAAAATATANAGTVVVAVFVGTWIGAAGTGTVETGISACTGCCYFAKIIRNAFSCDRVVLYHHPALTMTLLMTMIMVS